MTYKCLKCLEYGADVYAENIWMKYYDPENCRNWFHRRCFKGIGIDGNWKEINRS